MYRPVNNSNSQGQSERTVSHHEMHHEMHHEPHHETHPESHDGSALLDSLGGLKYSDRPANYPEDLGREDCLNWTVVKKLHACIPAAGHCFALLYGATAYSAGIAGVVEDYNVSLTSGILAYSLYIWGIILAPMYFPHVVEHTGRNPVYKAATFGLAVFTLGAAYSETYTQLAVCRFFAGLIGGSSAGQIEGTFADVWDAEYTSVYYSFLVAVQLIGGTVGAVVSWHINLSWRWTQYTTLMVCCAALLLGFGAPETFRRIRQRNAAKRAGITYHQEPAPTGITFARIATLTGTRPFLLLAQPVVLMACLHLGLIFGVIFGTFIALPAVLADFSPAYIGSAFTTAIAGAVVSIIFTSITNRRGPIENRMQHAIFGATMIVSSLFWIGWSLDRPVVSITGIGFFVWGSAMLLNGYIPYLFDAFSRQKTLSALSIVAYFRLACGGIIPLVVPIASEQIGPRWTFATFGFIAAAFWPFPIIVYTFGRKLRKIGSDDGDGGALAM